VLLHLIRGDIFIFSRSPNYPRMAQDTPEAHSSDQASNKQKPDRGRGCQVGLLATTVPVVRRSSARHGNLHQQRVFLFSSLARVGASIHFCTNRCDANPTLEQRVFETIGKKSEQPRALA
jgi:hypothetical protein